MIRNSSSFVYSNLYLLVNLVYLLIQSVINCQIFYLSQKSSPAVTEPTAGYRDISFPVLVFIANITLLTPYQIDLSTKFAVLSMLYSDFYTKILPHNDRVD